MIGKALSHYRILEPLGAGGMGVVYRALDERLEREVALKVLPEGLFTDEDARRRFRREALAASRVNHPSVGTVYDFDAEQGTDFLVMEYVTGESLDKRLSRGPMAEEEAIALASQIAEALEAVHDVDVVHCDLKPGNIIVSPRGHVKVLDFGVARLLRRGGGPDPTAPLTTMNAVAGTLAYMAPEQLLSGAMDARTDLYSLGVVLYEMTTGRRPHVEDLPAALIYAIVNTAPPPPRQLRPQLSQRLEDVLLKLLEKDPELRYASARDLAVDLRRLRKLASGDRRAGRPEGDRPRRLESLAVLPLENLSGDPSQEFFADGMTEVLIASLAQIGALRVISRTSIMQYKGARKPLPAIARALDVDAIVEGTVMRSGERVRITAQLIEAASDRHLWARSYERDFCDVLSLQGEVAREIAEEIRVQLTPREEARLARVRAVSPAAFEAYLRGRHLWSKRTVAAVKRSAEFFEQAIDADPAYALAYAGLADAYNILGDQNAVAPEEAATKAKAAITRALEIDDQLGEVYTSLGFLRMFYEWDWRGAESAFAQALLLNPSYATGHQWYAEYLVSQRRFEPAIAEARRAKELDPFSLILGTTLADTLFFSRRYEEAILELRRVIEVDPSFPPSYADLGRVCSQCGRSDEAIEAFLEAARLTGSDPLSLPGLGHAYAVAGRRDEALRILENLRRLAVTVYVSPHAIAVIHVGLGEKDQAFEWLERAVLRRDRAMVWLKVHPRLDALRDDLRFEDLLRQVGFAT